MQIMYFNMSGIHYWCLATPKTRGKVSAKLYSSRDDPVKQVQKDECRDVSMQEHYILPCFSTFCINFLLQFLFFLRGGGVLNQRDRSDAKTFITVKTNTILSQWTNALYAAGDKLVWRCRRKFFILALETNELKTRVWKQKLTSENGRYHATGIQKVSMHNGVLRCTKRVFKKTRWNSQNWSGTLCHTHRELVAA